MSCVLSHAHVSSCHVMCSVSRFGSAYRNLQPRITKTLVQAFLDPAKPLTTHYGAIVGLARSDNKATSTALTALTRKHHASITEAPTVECSSGQTAVARSASRLFCMRMSFVQSGSSRDPHARPPLPLRIPLPPPPRPRRVVQPCETRGGNQLLWRVAACMWRLCTV